MLRLALALALSLLAGTAAALPTEVARALERAGIPVESVAIFVQPVDTSHPELSHNADRPMNPASVMKLVTAFAVLERLGPGFTWTTRVTTDGAIHDGHLAGNLHLVGGGDPLLDVGRLWRVLARVRAAGITHIDGDIVLDASALRLPPHDAAAFDNRPLRPYNSGPSGLLLNFNTIQLLLTPGAIGAPLSVAAVPALDGLTLDNRITTAAGRCVTWYRDLDSSFGWTADGPVLTLTGSMPADCGAREWAVSPFASDDFAAALTGWLWKASGGALAGRVRHGVAPYVTTPLFEHTSPSSAEAVREMNKWSSNVIAQQLLATLAMHEPDTPDMLAAGGRIAAETLTAAGIPAHGLLIDNGSGLSRTATVRADTLGRLLLTAWQRPWMPEFVSALSLAGIDGTARKRLNGSPANGQAHIKTGTLNGVRAMAGYVLDRNGRRQVVVMLVNDANAPQSEAAQDALIEWVWGGNAM